MIRLIEWEGDVNESGREAILQELARRQIVYRAAGAEHVRCRSVSFRSTTGADLPIDIYDPTPAPTTPAPVVVIASGYADAAGRTRRFGPVTSWARLLATSGIATVVYGTPAPAADLDSVLGQLRRGAGRLGLDAVRIGLFAASGNVPVALATLMHDADVRCATLFCGYTMDSDSTTIVRDMAAQAGFVDACAGRTCDDLPTAVPMLFVRAGADQFAGLNARLDTVIARSLARNLSLAVINHPTGVHGFDLYDETVESQRIIRQVVAFLRLHLDL